MLAVATVLFDDSTAVDGQNVSLTTTADDDDDDAVNVRWMTLDSDANRRVSASCETERCNQSVSESVIAVLCLCVLWWW